MRTGIQIGGVEGKHGASIVAALRQALNEAIRRGQNDVAKSIASDIARLGGANNSSIMNCQIGDK